MAESLLDRLTMFGKKCRLRSIDESRKAEQLRRQIENVPKQYADPDDFKDEIAIETDHLRRELADHERRASAFSEVSGAADRGYFYQHPDLLAEGALNQSDDGSQDLFGDCVGAGLVLWTTEEVAQISRDAEGTTYGRS